MTNRKKEDGQQKTTTTAAPKETTTIEVVTPEMAAAWLKTNTRNRKPLKSYVSTLASAITVGEWRVTHQGIAFGADGTLYDGQHRLMAVVEAGVAVKMRVTRGLPLEARDAIDTGTSRRAHDVLAITDGVVIGTAVRSAVAAAANLALAGSMDAGGKRRLSVHGLRTALKEHGYDVRQVLLAFGSGHNRLTKAAMIGALAITHRTHPAKTIEFAEMIRSGENMAAVHPAAQLRNFVLMHYIATGGTSMDDLALRTFSAFDSFVHSREVKQLKCNLAARAKYLRPWRGETAEDAEDAED